MGLTVAIKAFLKAFREPEKAECFVNEFRERMTPPAEQSHLRLLALLQNSGRLVDFLKEDLSSFSDAQVGGAARKVHADCAKVLEELVTLRPVLEDHEGAKVRVPAGFDPSAIRVVGKITGSPPYEGVLKHAGWKAHKRSLPKKIGGSDSEVICPAEVEVRLP